MTLLHGFIIMLQLHSWFKHRTLKDKIIFVLSITILCCLLASFTASLVQNAMTVRSSAVDQFTLLSNIVSKQVALNLDIANRVSVPAMVSGYRQQAERTLSALSMEQSVVLSCVYLKNKSLFATYQQSTTQCPDSIPKEGYHFSDLNFHIVLPIHDINGKLQGYIYLLSNLKKIKENIFIGLGINFVFVLILLCIVYIVMVGKLQKWLANPILKLMDVTQRVLKEKDYSIRAYKHYDDEIGHLTEQFNTMLSKIEQRDRELQDYSETLEQKVEERTD